MDTNNKHYNLIKEQVEKHKKFPGNEYILEEIIDDVYSHSEFIMNSVTNEAVINAYLQKVITTSIITVSKDMKQYGEVTAPALTVEQPALSPKPVEDIETSSSAGTVNNDLVEKMINNSYNETKEETEEIFEEIIEEEINYDTLEEIEISVAEEQEETEENKEPSIVLEQDLLTEVEEDKQDESLVETALETDITTEEDTLEELEVNKDIHEADIFVEEPVFEETLEEEVSESFEVIDDLEETDSNTIDLDAPNNILTEDFSVSENIVETLSEDSTLEVLPEENEENNLEFEGDLLTEAEPLEENLIAEEVEQNIPNRDEEKAALPDFSVFEFSPADIDDEIAGNVLSIEDVQSSLETIDIRNPELKIKEVYKFKYEEGLSVSEISNKLDIPEEDVLTGLTELVGLI